MSNTSKFTIVIPVHNQFDQAAEYLESWFSLAKGALVVIFIDNGSDKRWEYQDCVRRWKKDHYVSVIRNDQNVGVYPTFKQGFDDVFRYTDLNDRPWIFYSHSDVQMLLPGWDEKLRRLLEMAHSRNAGVCGMFGARGIGEPTIYKEPFAIRQMMRWDCHTIESMAHSDKNSWFYGGAPVTKDLTPCMVLDGFSLIVRRQVIDDTGGFDHDRYPVHHMYDSDICLQSYYGGYQNFVLDLDCIHHGGMTSTREKWAEDMGTTDLEIHTEAHKVFYEKWRGKLPVGV